MALDLHGGTSAQDLGNLQEDGLALAPGVIESQIFMAAKIIDVQMVFPLTPEISLVNFVQFR